MSDEMLSFEEIDVSELSEEDLAIIQAFEAMDVWPPRSSPCQTNDQNKTPEIPQASSLREGGEMLLIFAAEAEEDISSIRQILNQLAQDEPGKLTLFIALKRAGHKLHGTAGAAGFTLISTIADQIELIAEGVSCGTISAYVGIEAISAATTVLEVCLQVIASVSEELQAPLLLASLAAIYQSLHIDLQQLEQGRAATNQIDARTEKFLQPTSPIRIDARRFEHPPVCTEPLAEQPATMEDAQTEVACALQELYVAQTRLQRLKPLIAQLQEGENEQKALIYVLKEAITALAITTADVQSAFISSPLIPQDDLASITDVHKDIHLHIPHANRSVLCFLVRVGDQHLLIPFNQIQHIGNAKRERTSVRYSLQELLGFPSGVSLELTTELQGSTSQYLPLLILCPEDETMRGGTVGIVVDEVLREQECVVEPLSSYLQRPGIAGATIDGEGRVLLVVDLLELLRLSSQY